MGITISCCDTNAIDEKKTNDIPTVKVLNPNESKVVYSIPALSYPPRTKILSYKDLNNNIYQQSTNINDANSDTTQSPNITYPYTTAPYNLVVSGVD
jgi:hypothetical protein